MRELTERLLDEWSDPLGSRTMSDAEDLIHMLLVEIAGKEEVIKALEKDIQYYKRVIKDTLKQQPYMATRVISICNKLENSLIEKPQNPKTPGL